MTAALLSLAVAGLASPCLAQFPRSFNANLTEIVSPLNPDIKVTYKVPQGACTTAFASQQQYTGWVNVPGTYQSNIFFWFVAAREPTSLLTIWLNGGPGSSSMFGLFTESGPCEIIEQGASRLGTVARQWGWDRASNMLFIDQPNQVGFSYDVPTNGTLDVVQDEITVPPVGSGEYSPLFLNGTFSSQNTSATANTTDIAAIAIYHMMQGFLTAFPQYNPPDSSSLGVNLFAESYGGKYGPTFAEIWEEENDRRANGTSPTNATVDIHLTALGIMNGCVDDLIQGPFYPAMLVNNTYGLTALPPKQADLTNASFYSAGGCQDAINQCRTAQGLDDPENQGTVDSVNDLCHQAQRVCTNSLLAPYGDSGRSYYDIAHQVPDSFPPSYYLEYLNSHELQEAIGSVVNFTDTSDEVYTAFSSTGDWERGPMVPKLASLLRSGIRIGLVYGDRDFICNWMGGEAVSLSIARDAGGAYASAFPAAGYAPIIVNDSYIGGVVRQFGNLSFSRVYQAGHFVPASQPETAFQVFARIITGKDVGTGKDIDPATFNTTGPANATSSLPLPDSPAPTCYVRALGSACQPDQIRSLRAGEGVIINGVWYPASSSWPGATAATATAGGATGMTTAALTGVYTATATPDNAGNAAFDPRPGLGALAAGYITAFLYSRL